MPDPPPGLLPETVHLWEEYWHSDVVRAASKVDYGAIWSYFQTYDLAQTYAAAARDKPFTTGSQGQIRVNPAADEAAKLMGMLPRLAAEIGMSPLSRAKLAIAGGDAAKTVEDLNREAKLDRTQDEDPRSEVFQPDQSG